MNLEKQIEKTLLKKGIHAITVPEKLLIEDGLGYIESSKTVYEVDLSSNKRSRIRDQILELFELYQRNRENIIITNVSETALKVFEEKRDNELSKIKQSNYINIKTIRDAVIGYALGSIHSQETGIIMAAAAFITDTITQRNIEPAKYAKFYNYMLNQMQPLQ